jgi:hypothetical protein
MGLIEIDVVGLEAPKRGLDGRADIALRQSLLTRSHFRADLGGDHEPVTIAARLHPLADDGFRLAALMAGHPGGIHIRCVDEVQAGIGVGVEHLERRCLVGRPAEDIAAEAQGRNHQVRAAEPTLFHLHLLDPLPIWGG